MNPSPDTSLKSTHIAVLDHLRGLAALLVFICHFGVALAGFPHGERLVAICAYGECGVEMFFAISGFVIPYSMFLRGHVFRDSGNFLLRRMARLEPPYLACIALIVCLNAITQFRAGAGEIHSELQMTLPQFFAHLGYMNAIIGYRWLNVVFWTLAIEFQFYLFALIAYPLICSPHPPIRVISLIAIACIGFTATGSRLDHPPLLLFWLPLFAMGMTTCSFVTGQLSRTTAGTVLLLVTTIAAVVNGVASAAFAMVPVSAILVLGSQEPSNLLRPLAWLGTISYSFYLLHLPIGLRALAHARKFCPTGNWGECLATAVAFASVLCCAFAFYLLVEKPAQRWSKSIGRRRANETNWNHGSVSNDTSIPTAQLAVLAVDD